MLWLRLRKKEAEERGLAAALFSDRHRLEYLDAAALLAPHGVGVLDAVRDWVSGRAPVEGGKTLGEVFQAVQGAKAASGAEPRYLRTLAGSMRIIGRDLGGQPVGAVTSGDIERWLAEHTEHPTTRRNYLQVFHLALAFALKRRWVGRNVAAEVDRPKIRHGEPHVLTVRQARAVLSKARRHSWGMFACVLINLFAGLRPSETARLTWKEVQIGRRIIEVRSRKVRSARFRLVHIEENLAEWLLSIPESARRGAICPPNYFKKLGVIVRQAKVQPWPADVMRHSFGSYHYARYQDAARTAAEMGHAGTGTLFAYYRAAVTREAAGRFWGIRPRSVKTG